MIVPWTGTTLSAQTFGHYQPWDQAAHEQHDRAIEQGDPPAHPGRGRLPRLQQRAHARMRQNPLRHLTLVVGPAIHGHVPAR